ncbi:hypothetical protein DV735_g2555, partial [Chaetothyriales sp. CBS 134920]
MSTIQNLKNFIRHGKQARAVEPPRDQPTTNVSTVHAQKHGIGEVASGQHTHNSQQPVQHSIGPYSVGPGDTRNLTAQASAAAAHTHGKGQKLDRQADIEAIVAEEREKARKMPRYPGLERYILSEKMGDGAFSNVYRARDTQTNEQVAIKVVRKFEMNSNQVDAHLHPDFKKQPKVVEVRIPPYVLLPCARANILKEVQIMRQLDHPNIVRLIDFSESRQYYYIVLELCPGGELFHHIVRLTYFSEDLSRHVIVQVAKALRYLHEERGVVHRDIKPENLLFYPIPFIPTKNPKPRGPDDEDKADEGEFIEGVGSGGIGQIKLADFGLSKVVWDSQTMTPCGTVGYTAPEIVKDERYSKSVDMWALGCVLYTLLCGFPPFYDESIQVLTEKVARGQYTFLSPWWDDISKSAQDLVSHLLTVNPDKRYTIDEFLAHPWIRNTSEPTYAAADAPPLATPLAVRQKEWSVASKVADQSVPDFPQTPGTPGTRRMDFRSPGAVNLREVFDVGYAVHRQEEEAKRRKNFKQGYRGAGATREDDDEEKGEEIDTGSRKSTTPRNQLRVSPALKSFLVAQNVLPEDDGSDEALKALLDKPPVNIPPSLTDRSHPLPDYFFNSSHNTYLLANQLYGTSDVSGYIHAIGNGARCVEIDAWDAEKNEEPKVTHGFTLVSNVPFRKVCETIRDLVDKQASQSASEQGYRGAPIFISLENHCSPQGQLRLVEIMKEVWGDRLLTKHVRDSDAQPGVADYVRLEELESKICVIVEHHLSKEQIGQIEESSSSSSSSETEEEKKVREEYKKKKKATAAAIIPELAELGVYAQSVKPIDNSWFEAESLTNGPHHPLINLSETSLAPHLRQKLTDIARSNSSHLMRVYPKGSRISSANLKPVPFWNAGAQICALNWQTFGASAQLNEALFAGTDGFILKPEALRTGGSADLRTLYRHADFDSASSDSNGFHPAIHMPATPVLPPTPPTVGYDRNIIEAFKLDSTQLLPNGVADAPWLPQTPPVGHKRNASAAELDSTPVTPDIESPDQNTGEDGQGKKKPVKRACNECRQQKLRCDVVQSPFTVCSRCRRLRLECKIEDNFKRIGKRSRNAEMEREIVELRRQVADQAALLRSAGVSNPSIANGARTTPQPQNFAHDAAAGLLDLRSGLDKTASNSASGLKRLGSVVLTAERTRELHQRYFTLFHPFLPFLNPERTADEYYQRSPLLFWVIMNVAARHFAGDPDLFGALCQPLSKLTWETLADVPQNYHVVKALILLCAWPLPTSSTSTDPTFMYCGLMIQIALQIGLHRPSHAQDFSKFRVELRDAELQDRVVVWSVCNIVAQRIATAYGQPPLTIYDWTLGPKPIENNPGYELPAPILNRLLIEKFVDRVTRSLYMNDKDPVGLTTDKDRGQYIKLLVDHLEHLEDQLRKDTSPITKIHLKAAVLHMRLSAFFSPPHLESYREDLLDLYHATTEFLEACLGLETESNTGSSNSHALSLSYGTNYIFYMMLAAGFSLLKLMHNFLSQHELDTRGASDLLTRTLFALRSMSVSEDDLAERLAEVLAQVWKSGRVRAEPSHNIGEHSRDDSLQLKVKCRMSTSLVFDSIWRWRKNFRFKGGRPAEVRAQGSAIPVDTQVATQMDSADAGNLMMPSSEGTPIMAAAVVPGMAGMSTGMLSDYGIDSGPANYEVFDPLNWMLDGVVDFPYSFNPTTGMID